MSSSLSGGGGAESGRPRADRMLSPSKDSRPERLRAPTHLDDGEWKSSDSRPIVRAMNLDDHREFLRQGQNRVRQLKVSL